MGYYPKKIPKSNHRGVKYAGKTLGKSLWSSSFTHNGKTFTSPKFKSEIKAAKWYDRTALKYLGDRAVLNYPDKLTPNRTVQYSSQPLAYKRTRSSSEDSTTTDTTDTTNTTNITSEIEDSYSKPKSAKRCRPDIQSQPGKHGQMPSKPEHIKSTRRKKFTQQTKNKICSRQKWNCNYCKRRLSDVYHIDHMVPLFIGGSNETWNLQSLCPSCDSFKSSYIDNKVLFPLSYSKTVTPEDVLEAQETHYHMMECENPNPNPMQTFTQEGSVVTNNINLNIYEIGKIYDEIQTFSQKIDELKNLISQQNHQIPPKTK